MEPMTNVLELDENRWEENAGCENSEGFACEAPQYDCEACPYRPTESNFCGCCMQKILDNRKEA